MLFRSLNIFAVGFPVTIIIGFVALLVTMPGWVSVLENLFRSGLDAAARIAANRP